MGVTSQLPVRRPQLTGRECVTGAMVLIACLWLAPSAIATHPRPGGGSPLRVPLVSAYGQCTTAAQNSNHVAPLALDSCSPPNELADITTTSTTGAGQGSFRLGVFCSDGASPPCNTADSVDSEDVRVVVTSSDIRCTTITGSCPLGAGSDYDDDAFIRFMLRITDHSNSAEPSAGAACTNSSGFPPCVSATVIDLSFALPIACTTTPASSNGSNCNLDTTLDSQIPGMVIERQRTSYSMPSPGPFYGGSVVLLNQGPNNSGGITCPPFCGTGDEEPMMVQGLFLP
jgi:hypothetical protein